MKRRLFNAGAGVSLLCFVVAVALWGLVPRGGVSANVMWVTSQAKYRRTIRVLVAQGGVGVEVLWEAYPALSDHPRGAKWDWGRLVLDWPPFLDTPETFSNRLGFGYRSETGGVGGTYWEESIAFPLWFVMAITALMPIWFVIRHRAAQRLRQTAVCPACGYDLRGTPSGGAGGSECPECGAASGGRETKA